MARRKKEERKRIIARLIGNWGTAFFGPLVSGNVAESYYGIGITIEQTVFIALLSSLFVTGLTISKELEKLGKA